MNSMNKIIFKVSTKKEGNVVSFMKEINKISSRIQIDLEAGLVTVEDADNAMIDSVMEVINQHCNILNVIINNTSDEPTSVEPSQSVAIVDESNLKTNVEETAEPENEPTVVSPQSESDLNTQKIELKDEYVEDLINKLTKTVYWALYKKNVLKSEIRDFVNTFINEISMRYNGKSFIQYSVGDIVECNYGTHLKGETNGSHVFAIVCNIINDGNMVYLAPIIKVKENIASHSYLTFNAPKDVVYNNGYRYTGGTVLLDKGKYLRSVRLNRVIGKATPEFFAKVLDKLSTTFDFTGDTVIADDGTETNLDNEVFEVAETEAETTSEEHTTEGNCTQQKPADADNLDVTTAEPKKSAKKVGDSESALLEVIGESLEKLDPTKKAEEQVESFLTDIGMTTSESVFTQSFLVACNIEKINYENVILELREMFPKVKENIIKLILKENFKKWLNLHPELVERCPKISIMAMLKVFARKFA